VHVWRADLPGVPEQILELLDSEERARGERLASKRDSRLWMSSRGVLRVLAARYLQRDPSSLRFATGAHGKPELMPPSERGRRPRLSLNLSHSGRLALYAFSATGSIGVDVEVPRRPIDEVALAARAFGPAEAQRLEGLGPAERRSEFLRAWVRHEAELKCRGTGIGRACAEGASPRAPWIAELDVGLDGAAAVALQEPPRELHCWAWLP
jgi:4'-phosphopantetheinyl transferase